MKKGAFRFEILHESRVSRARVGRIVTPHGTLDTPGLVFVGTQGTLKHIAPDIATGLGMQAMFCNTYHLLLQPSLPELVEAAGGLHAFTAFSAGPILTDSGGFQAFSMAPLSSSEAAHKSVTPRGDASTYGGTRAVPTRRSYSPSANSQQPSTSPTGFLLKVTEDGLIFRSYRDGRRVELTPEASTHAQKKLGADIILPLDELLPSWVEDERRLRRSLERTHRWQERSLRAHAADPRGQAMYGIVHGGASGELRRESARLLLESGARVGLPFDGLAVGGSVGRNADDLGAILDELAPALPGALPRHLLGIGDTLSVLAGAVRGMDSFDSAYPTRIGRHGTILTDEPRAMPSGKLNLLRAEHRTMFDRPLRLGCGCPTCAHYSMAYLHHLHRAHEPAGMALTAVHNVFFMAEWMSLLRERILRDEL